MTGFHECRPAIHRTADGSGTFTLGDAKLFAQYMTRKNDNPIVTPLDLQQLVIAGGTPAGISALLTPMIPWFVLPVGVMAGLASASPLAVGT